MGTCLSLRSASRSPATRDAAPWFCKGQEPDAERGSLGDIHLADVRAWYEDRVTAAGLEHVEPIWGEPPDLLLGEFISSGGRAVITCVDLAKLDEAWLGRIIDERFATEIEAAGVDPCGENGEYHSFAFAGPVFKAPLPWMPGARRLDSGFAQLDLTEGRPFAPISATPATRGRPRASR